MAIEGRNSVDYVDAGTPFSARDPAPLTVWRRLISARNPDAFPADLETCLAECWPQRSPSRAEIAAIESKHRITIAGRGRAAGRALLLRAAESLVARIPFRHSPELVREMAKAFGLDLREAANVLHAAGLSMLRREVKATLADERVTDEEQRSVHSAAALLGVSSDEVTAAFVEQIGALFYERVHEALADGELSPDEDAYLDRLATQLNMAPSFDPKMIDTMQTARNMWRLMRGPLPKLDAPFYLERAEQCVFIQNSEAIEQRTRTSSYRYRGASFSVPIVKGLRFRVGQGRVHRETEEYRHSFGKGVFCATNKRLIFNGPNKNLTIKLRKIIDFDPYTDGVRIVKDTGKPLLIVFSEERRNFAPLLSRLLSEAR